MSKSTEPNNTDGSQRLRCPKCGRRPDEIPDDDRSWPRHVRNCDGTQQTDLTEVGG